LYFGELWGLKIIKLKQLSGGPEETRTPDLLHAMEALYQLSYRPVFKLIYP
jgi:hypothetical protein